MDNHQTNLVSADLCEVGQAALDLCFESRFFFCPSLFWHIRHIADLLPSLERGVPKGADRDGQTAAESTRVMGDTFRITLRPTCSSDASIRQALLPVESQIPLRAAFQDFL